MSQKSNRAAQAAKAVAKVERDMEGLLDKARAFEARFERDPIKTLGLHYRPGEGLQVKRIEVKSGGIKFSSQPLPPSETSPARFSPPRAEIGTAFVEPLDLVPTPWTTLVAFRIGHEDAEYRPRLRFLNNQNRAESAIFLLDEDNSEYYYPISTDLGGEVLPGYPKVGLVAFEPFRRPTSRISVHIRELKLTSKRGERLTAVFTAQGDPANEIDLPSMIEAVTTSPSLAEQVEMQMKAELDPQLSVVRAQANPGCMFILGVAAVAGSVAAWSLTFFA